MADLWDYFDTDSSGCISESEFVTGMMSLALKDASNLEMTQALQLLKTNMRQVKSVRASVEELKMELCQNRSPSRVSHGSADAPKTSRRSSAKRHTGRSVKVTEDNTPSLAGVTEESLAEVSVENSNL